MQNLPKSKKPGFSLIELIMVIALIAAIMVVLVIIINPAGRVNQARTESAKAKMKALSNAVEVARAASQKTMLQITGSTCTECTCRCVDARTNSSCINAVNNSWAKISQKGIGKDPWGNTLMFDENEQEFNQSDCRYDFIYSAGPDHIRGHSSCSSYYADDIQFTVPHIFCNP